MFLTSQAHHQIFECILSSIPAWLCISYFKMRAELCGNWKNRTAKLIVACIHILCALASPKVVFLRLFWDCEVSTKIATRNCVGLWRKASLWPLKDQAQRDSWGRYNLPALEKNVFPGVPFFGKRQWCFWVPCLELPVWAGLWQGRGSGVSDGPYRLFVWSSLGDKRSIIITTAVICRFAFVATSQGGSLRVSWRCRYGCQPLSIGCLEWYWLLWVVEWFHS